MSIAITNKTIDRFLGFLFKLDNNSKKKLIIKLTESIETERVESSDLKEMYGAWQGSKDSDEIISDIRNSRIENKNIPEF